MAHEGLLTFFVIFTCLAVIIQAGILYALYRTLSQLVRGVVRIDAGLEQHVHPLLSSLHEILAGAREPIGTTLANLAEISRVVRERTAGTDAFLADVLDRARVEILRADRLMASSLEKMERASEAVERSVLVPVREVSAVIAGVRRGLEFFLSRRSRRSRSSQEEQLFI
jgi:hypothetical protein